jgi:hypothetical protein
LQAEEVPEETAGNIPFVASELATNGVLHDGGATITLRARRSPARVSVEVRTADRPAGAAPYPRGTDGPMETGRRLLIVAALADDHTVATGGGHRVDLCQFRLDHQAIRDGAGARERTYLPRSDARRLGLH